jgi:hypothetical protein
MSEIIIATVELKTLEDRTVPVEVLCPPPGPFRDADRFPLGSASVFLALTPMAIIESSLCDLNSFDNGHNSARLVGSLIKPNDRLYQVHCSLVCSISGRSY